MRYAFFPGCATPARALNYEKSARAVALRLGIELSDVPEFDCCGFPVKSMDFPAALLMAARNLAIAEERGLDIVSVCSGCVAVLSEAREYLKDENLRRCVNEKLRVLGMREYSGKSGVKHFARVLHDLYGVDRIREKIAVSLSALTFGVHYGCHYMRPAHAHGNFDDPARPVTLDRLVAGTGARTIDYPNKNLCCGMTIMGASEDLGFRLAAEKLEGLSGRGADAMVVACPSCCIAYECNQRLIGKRAGKAFDLPVLYFTQVIGLALGLSEKELGFELNRIKVGGVTAKLSS